MHASLAQRRAAGTAYVTKVKDLYVLPDPEDLRSVAIDAHYPYRLTHWAFSQLCELGKVRSDWLREVGKRGGGPLVADNLNFGLKFMREVEEVGLLVNDHGTAKAMLRAGTGPRYGRVWDDEVIAAVIEHYGDGLTGDFRVPGEFGARVVITKDNTTLYAGDRDMFIFLADEEHRVEVPNRRNGAGSLARGFFLWNSEVGKTRLGMGTFLFDYVCCNRIVWGSEAYAEVAINHTAGAPERWLSELKPALKTYANSSQANIVEAVKSAQAAKLEGDVAAFMAERFGARIGATMAQIHILEEQRPIETVWDAATAATAYARTIEHQDARVALERKAGELLRLAA
jgi:hypothetical protein